MSERDLVERLRAMAACFGTAHIGDEIAALRLKEAVDAIERLSRENEAMRKVVEAAEVYAEADKVRFPAAVKAWNDFIAALAAYRKEK